MEEVEEAALLPAAPTLRSGKLDRPVQYRFFSAVPIFWSYGIPQLETSVFTIARTFVQTARAVRSEKSRKRTFDR